MPLSERGVYQGCAEESTRRISTCAKAHIRKESKTVPQFILHFVVIIYLQTIRFPLTSFNIGIPTDWCLENVAKLLKLCGESVCFEVLGNKAMNGRVHELSYLGYYLGQVFTHLGLFSLC